MIIKSEKPFISTNMTVRYILVIASTLMLSSCFRSSSSNTNDTTNVARLDTAQIHAIDTKKIKYAQNLDIKYFKNYKLVTVRNSAQEKKDSLQYVLLEKNKPIPKGFSEKQVIRIPVERVISLSSIQVGMIDEIHKIESLVGISSRKYVVNSAVHQRLAEGKIQEVGEASTLNEEVVLSLKPDVILVSAGTGNSLPMLKKMQKLNIKILVNADWLETTPLGRSEWIKLVGALYHAEKITDAKFDKIKFNYTALAQKTKHLPKPKVITGVPYKGIWYLPAGESYVARFLDDAGAFYYKKNTKGTGSIPLDFEQVYAQNSDVDFWINVGSFETKVHLLNMDKKFAHFKAFQNDKIYNYHRRKGRTGALDYYETGTMHPDVILADLIKIFHPKLLPNHRFFYYKKLD